MKLKSFRTQFPVQLFNEGGDAVASFVIGARCGIGLVSALEATPVGVVVSRRSETEGVELEDLLLTGPGSGQLLEKRRQEPAQLKGAR
jgi:hypothetical protein